MLNQTQVWSKSSSVKLYTLIHPNLYQCQGHPCFRLKRSVEAQHPRNVPTSTEQHTLHTHTHTPGSSHLPRHTAIQGSNSGGIGAAATHYRRDRVLIGREVRLEGIWTHLTDLVSLKLNYALALRLPLLPRQLLKWRSTNEWPRFVLTALSHHTNNILKLSNQRSKAVKTSPRGANTAADLCHILHVTAPHEC